MYLLPVTESGVRQTSLAPGCTRTRRGFGEREGFARIISFCMGSSSPLQKRANKTDAVNEVVFYQLLLFVRTPLLENKVPGNNWISRNLEGPRWVSGLCHVLILFNGWEGLEVRMKRQIYKL